MFGTSRSVFSDFLKDMRVKVYNTPGSCLKEYHDFLNSNGINIALCHTKIQKQLKNRRELCEKTLLFYDRAKLPNERLALLEDLQIMGYDKNKLVELILNEFYRRDCQGDLWEYADMLYSLRNFIYITQYLDIILDKSYGDARQMLILLVGESRKEFVVPVLKELLNDSTVYGHALDALSNFTGADIETIMCEYRGCNVEWVREIAEKYLSKNNKR